MQLLICSHMQELMLVHIQKNIHVSMHAMRAVSFAVSATCDKPCCFICPSMAAVTCQGRLACPACLQVLEGTLLQQLQAPAQKLSACVQSVSTAVLEQQRQRWTARMVAHQLLAAMPECAGYALLKEARRMSMVARLHGHILCILAGGRQHCHHPVDG